MWQVSRKYLLGVAFAGVVAFGVTEAQAQQSWSGPYFGLHAGYGWANTDITYDNGNSLFPDSFGGEGWLAGAHLGLNVQLSQFWVVGGELSLSKTSIDGSKRDDCFAPGSGITCTSGNDWLLLAMGRLGYTGFGPMVYGTAGWAVGGITTNLELVGINPNFFRASAVHDGFAYGAGIEWQLPSGMWGGCCNRITFGLEYLHVDLAEKTHQSELMRHVSEDLDIIRARLSIALDSCKGCRQ